MHEREKKDKKRVPYELELSLLILGVLQCHEVAEEHNHLQQWQSASIFFLWTINK